MSENKKIKVLAPKIFNFTPKLAQQTQHNPKNHHPITITTYLIHNLISNINQLHLKCQHENRVTESIAWGESTQTSIVSPSRHFFFAPSDYIICSVLFCIIAHFMATHCRIGWLCKYFFGIPNGIFKKILKKEIYECVAKKLLLFRYNLCKKLSWNMDNWIWVM